MSNRYKGGFISGTPPTTSGTPYTGSAGGMWTASQVFQAKASGLWPVAGPSAPTSLSVVPFNASATVTFSGATVTAGKPAITSYTVTAFPGGRFVTGAASPLTVTGLTNDVLHTFTVSATNSDGTSIPSSGVTETPMLFLPTAPTAISGSGQDGQVVVSFSGATVASGKPAISSYTVTVSPGGATVTGAASPLTVTGLTNGNQYTFTVVATNADGNSPASIASAAVAPSSYMGKLFTWGANATGTLGDGTTINRSSPVQVAGTTWSRVAGGGYHILGTKTDGTLWLWGKNNNGQLGLGDVTHKSSPVQVGAGTTWLNIASGYGHTIATKTDGTLWAWGLNSSGQLGDGTVIHRSSPVQVGALTAWSKIAGGGYHTIAIKTDGTLWLWGYNQYGQLGLGDRAHRSSPVQIGTGTTWSNIAGGYQHTIATKTDGTLWLCGMNNYMQLGINRTPGQWYGTYHSTPVQINGGTTWNQVGCGDYTGTATKTDGTLWQWGWDPNHSGVTQQLIAPTQISALTTFSKVASGGYMHMSASTTDGTLWNKGNNASGQLGDGTTNAKQSLGQLGTKTTWNIDITDGSFFSAGIASADLPATSVISSVEQTDTGKVTVSFTTPKLAGITTTWTATSSPGGLTASNTTGLPITVTGLSSGVPYTFTVRGSTADGLAPSSVASSSVTLVPTYVGRLWLTGWGAYGQLGNGGYANKSSLAQVGTLTTWLNISAGVYNSNTVGGIKTDGTLWTWGSNSDGQLGQNNTTIRISPVQVGTGTTWSKISEGQYSTIATKTDGTLWAWGLNANGQLGQGDVARRSSPVQVGAGTTWLNISSGKYATAATKTDGTLWLWGRNHYGQLGLGDTVTRPSPVQVGTGTTWSNATTSRDATFAIKTDGTLWSWGTNAYGQLGQGDRVYKSSPVQVGTGTTWSKISEGKWCTFAIKTDGTLWSWGYNPDGQLGQGDIINRSSPVQVGTGTTWSEIGCGAGQGNAAAAIKTDGTLWSWGYNAQGQAGQNDAPARSSPVQVGTLTNWRKISVGGGGIMAISGPVTGVTPTGVTVETIDTTATISYTPGA